MSEDKTVVAQNDKKDKEKKVKNKTTEKKFSLPWIIGVVVLVLLSLVMVLPTTCLANTSSNLVSFGTYNGKKIELTNNSFLYFQYIQLYNYYAQSYGESTAQSYDYYIWNNAFQQAVVNEAFQEMAEKAGFKATKEQIAEAIVNSGYYTDADAYNSASDAQKEQIKGWMTEYVPYQEVYSTINSVPVSSAESAFINTLNEEKRNVEYIVLDSNLYPSEDAVKYASERADLFKVVSFTKASYATEEEAANAVAAFNSGSKSATELVAESKSSTAENNGKVESYYRFQMNSDLASYAPENAIEIYTAAENTAVGPVETSEGYTVYVIEKAASDPDFSDENTIAMIRAYIASNDGDVIMAYLDTIVDGIYAEASEDFEKAAEKNDLTVSTLSDVCLNTGSSDFIYSFNYADSTGYFTSQASADPSWAEKLFSADFNTVLEPFAANGAYVIARPVESAGTSTASYMSSYFTTYYSYYLPTYTLSDYTSELFLSEKAVNDVSNGYITLIMNNLSAQSN